MDNNIQHHANSTRSVQHSYGRTEKVKANILKGIELDLFSYHLAENDFENKLAEACGQHFICELIKKDVKHSTYYITPQEYSLVNGGMLYKSAGNIVSKLTNKGILIAGMREVIQ